MKLKNTMVLILALVLAASMIPGASAEYSEYQYFEAEEGTTEVYTVQLAASGLVGDSASLRKSLLEAGLDGFVLHMNGRCYVMSGKFDTEEEARTYREAVNTLMNRTGSLVVKAKVPEDAVENFRENYVPFEDVFTDGIRHHGFSDEEMEFRLKDGGGQVYAVQVAQGPNEDGALQMADDLREKGYYAYVYDMDENGIFRIICGAFSSKDDAETYKTSLNENAGIYDAYIVDILIPMTAVKDFSRIYY